MDYQNSLWSFNSLMRDNTDGIILREFLDIIRNSKYENIQKFIKYVCTSFFKFILLIVIKGYIQNTNNIYVVFMEQFKKILKYKQLRLDLSKLNPDLCLMARLKGVINEQQNNREFLPMFCNYENDIGIIKYNPLLHNSIIKKNRDFAQKDFNNKQNKNKNGEIITKYVNSEDRNIIIRKYFPSENILKLENILKRHYEIMKETGQYFNTAILINGKPGLGKTASMDYIANQNIVEVIIKIDLTKKLDDVFMDIINAFREKYDKNQNIIIMIDEVDKYISYQLDKIKINETEKINDKNSVLIDKSIDIKITNFKNKILYDILNLLECNDDLLSITYIFCCNNFETIFEGVNKKHFMSLKNRFINVEYKECEIDEIKKYVKYINESIKNTNLYVSDNELNNLLNKLKSDIKITYRKIFHLLISVHYDIRKLINQINENHYDDFDELKIQVGKEKPKPNLNENSQDTDIYLMSNSDDDEYHHIYDEEQEPEEQFSDDDYKLELVDMNEKNECEILLGKMGKYHQEQRENEELFKNQMDKKYKESRRFVINQIKLLDIVNKNEKIPLIIKLYEHLEENLNMYQNEKKFLNIVYQKMKEFDDHDFGEYESKKEILFTTIKNLYYKN